MNRVICEQEIAKIIEGYQKEPLSPADYYRVKTVDLLATITDEIYLQKIYSYAFGFTMEQL